MKSSLNHTRAMAMALSATLMLAMGCSRHDASERYILVATNTKVPYWQTAYAGFTKAATDYGVQSDMRGPDVFDPQAELKAFQDAAASKPSGILVSVADASLLGPAINSAIAAGIPVITVDSDAPGSQRLYFIGTNNLEAGRLGAARVAAALNGKGNVVFFTNPGQPNLDDRLKGYKDVFTRYPGIKIADVFDIKSDPGSALDKTGEYLVRTGADKIDAFVCLESASCRGVAERFKRENTQGRLIVAMDSDPGTLELIKSGVIDSTVAQKPYTMALLGLKALDEVHHNPPKPLAANYALDPYSPFPSFIDTGVALVDKTNVDSVLSRMPAAKQ